MHKYIMPFVRWFDNTANPDTKANSIDYLRIIPFIAIHVGCLAVLWVGVSTAAVVIAVFLYCLRIFLIGAIYHRYFSHKAFKMSRGWQFVFTLLAMTAIQRGPLWWAAHHREHHLNSDEPGDPHSPHHGGFLWSHMGWFLSHKNFHLKKERIQDFSAYPELVFLDRFDCLVPIVFGLVLYGIGFLLENLFPTLGTTGLQLFIWGFCISTVCVYHATFSINSIAHKLGKKPHVTKDQSRNNWLLALLTFGEGWHNNHHRYPVSARQGFRWWQVDFTYYILKFLNFLGIISDLKMVPANLKK